MGRCTQFRGLPERGATHLGLLGRPGGNPFEFRGGLHGLAGFEVGDCQFAFRIGHQRMLRVSVPEVLEHLRRADPLPGTEEQRCRVELCLGAHAGGRRHACDAQEILHGAGRVAGRLPRFGLPVDRRGPTFDDLCNLRIAAGMRAATSP